MLIVSQYGDAVININVMESVMVGDDNTINAFVHLDVIEGNDMYYPVGEYKSKEKAKSVLRQLWSAYANGEKVFIMPEK